MEDKPFLTENKASFHYVKPSQRRRVAYYGGSFDPVHRGHIAIASKLIELFLLDEFVFIPAFHAPHKTNKQSTAAIHRYAMLCLATNDFVNVNVSAMELEMPEKPYTVETLGRLKTEFPESEIFFVMGSDSWNDIRTWREWEKVLLLTNHIVVTRPRYEIEFSHVTDEIRERIVDLRDEVSSLEKPESTTLNTETGKLGIYVTNFVNLDISATDIRKKIKVSAPDWRKDVPGEVAKYIEKYQIYK